MTRYRPITSSEARGNSRPVSAGQFQQLAASGAQFLHNTERHSSTAGLDRNWESIKDRAFEATRQPWGGATISGHSGKILSDSGNTVEEKTRNSAGFGKGHYAVTAKRPGQETVEVSPHLNREQFGSAMDTARNRFPQIGNRYHHLGVFHDAEKGTIDLDPVLVTRRPNQVERVGAYTHAIGGAYHVESGNGYFPPHVKESIVPKPRTASREVSHV